MSSANKIYAFFLFIALLFWNPLSLYFFYGNTPVYAFKLVHAGYWFLFATGLLLLYLLQKNKLSSKIKNLLWMGSVTGILFAMLVSINLFLNSDQNKIPKAFRNPATQGLIFPPNNMARYSSSEFKYIASTNSLGLRDKEVLIEKGKHFRILCFGDSWTFGWGVNVEESWPKKLQDYLTEAGIKNCEVINCGQPGAYTTGYTENMMRAIPLLKPDLVLVGVQQIDDLVQLFENSDLCTEPLLRKREKVSATKKIGFTVITFLKYSFGNIITAIGFKNKNAVEISPEVNKKSINQIINAMNGEEKKRFIELDPTLKTMFFSGNLNFGLLRYYVALPNMELNFNDPKLPATKFSINKMSSDIQAMKALCVANKCRLIFVNMPVNYFTGHKMLRNFNDTMNVYLETHNKVDSMYRSVADSSRISYIELTEQFKSLKNKSDYFFLYDGHPTAKGYDELAKGTAKQLIEQGILK